MDVLSTGCQWRDVPKDLPPPPAIPLGFAKRNLWPASPEQIGREASPTACASIALRLRSGGGLDQSNRLRCGQPFDELRRSRARSGTSQAAHSRRYFRAFASGNRASGGYSRPRRRCVGSLDLVRPTLFCMHPFLEKLFADGGYQGPIFRGALAKVLPHLKTGIVNRPDHAKRLRGSPAALGCRPQLRRLSVRHSIKLCLMEPLAHFAQPMPAIGQGF
jgi:hypothetical protein